MNWVIRGMKKYLRSQLQVKIDCRMSHKILIKKLLKYQLDEQAVRYTENRLNSQTQRVVTSGRKYGWSIGVNTGSILV